jgi:hypothetical protein
MTREEALYKKEWKGLGKGCSMDMTANIINTIYDNFESKTCENCEYFLIYCGSKQSGTCNNEDSIAYTSEESIYGDDGCNKWENRDE